MTDHLSLRQQLERDLLIHEELQRQRQDHILRILRDGLITASITGAILASILVVLVVIGYAH